MVTNCVAGWPCLLPQVLLVSRQLVRVQELQQAQEHFEWRVPGQAEARTRLQQGSVVQVAVPEERFPVPSQGKSKTTEART